MNYDIWLTAPEEAYAQWQCAEAMGADRRAFAEQSIVQHRSMFSRKAKKPVGACSRPESKRPLIVDDLRFGHYLTQRQRREVIETEKFDGVGFCTDHLPSLHKLTKKNELPDEED